jgi:NitT/TauT family transport system substrate-binding protein
MKKALLLTLIVVFSICFTFPAWAFTFRPQWVPQAQFAGYYMAAEKGFYEKAGIDVEIKPGGPGKNSLREAASGEIDFASGWLISAMRLHAGGKELVCIAQVLQRPALLLVAKKSSGIDSVEDFSGHSLGVWPGDFQVPPKALLRKYRIRDVKIVNQGFTMDAFISGELDIASAMKYNEYNQILAAGVEEKDLVVFNYSDLGMHLPEDGIYVNQDFYSSHPEACRKFVRASMEGWQYAFDNKDETVRLITGIANKTEFKTTEEKQMAMLEEIEQLIDVGDTRLKPEHLETANSVLKSTRIIRSDIDGASFNATAP